MWQAMVSCWQEGIPIIVRGDSHLHWEMPGWKSTLKDLLYPLFIKRFRVCAAVGKWSEDYFRHYGALRVVRSPHCVDNDGFAQRAAHEFTLRDKIRATWCLETNATVFLFAAKFIEKKRPMDLLRALGELGKQGVTASALMMGDGALREECESYARQHKLAATFIGFLNQNEISAAYAAADCLVLPSDGRETWGLVVNEAMASGIPAIVSDHVGCGPDLIVEGKTGFVYPLGDYVALSEAMKRVASDPTLLSRLKTGAKEHISRFSVGAAVDGICEAVELSVRNG